jgi:hypothetical protein
MKRKTMKKLTKTNNVLRWFAEHFPKRVITGGDATPYLSRYTIGSFFGRDLYLHCFHRGDADRDLHNHPWSKSFSIILSGGYIEHRRELITHYDEMDSGVLDAKFFHVVKTREVRPWNVNVIDHDTFHRIDLLDGECWSLFLTGERVSSWGFLKDGTKYVNHRNYLVQKGLPLEDT